MLTLYRYSVSVVSRINRSIVSHQTFGYPYFPLSYLGFSALNGKTPCVSMCVDISETSFLPPFSHILNYSPPLYQFPCPSVHSQTRLRPNQDHNPGTVSFTQIPVIVVVAVDPRTTFTSESPTGVIKKVKDQSPERTTLCRNRIVIDVTEETFSSCLLCLPDIRRKIVPGVY